MKLNIIPWVLVPTIALSFVVGLVCLFTHHDDDTWRKEWRQLGWKEQEAQTFVNWMEEQKKSSGYAQVFNKCKWTTLLALGLLVVIPSQTQTAVLVAGHYALRMADSPEASKVMQVLRKKANEYLDAELKEAK